MKQALGLIETIGLVTAIEAADAAVKAANVILLGFENTKGGGKITIKFVGNVGAVQAAVAAGVAAASRIGEVYGQRVIPRPSEEIDALILNLDRGRGLDEPKAEAPQAKETASAPTPVEPPEPKVEEATCAATTKSGEPCKLPVQPGSNYCFVHRNQAEK
ncbi:MAG: BMC domain-containing protein [Anaerolineae bacterium]|nr:BMC domain-containing protein [Anaerolineae bacterium]